MLGLCFFDKGQFEVASTVLRRAVDGDPGSEQEKIGLLYWLGRCEEEKSRPAEALVHYQRVFAVDISFKDIGRRVDSLIKATS
jgi:tetratricopeptide (TPR) repeat protein